MSTNPDQSLASKLAIPIVALVGLGIAGAVVISVFAPASTGAFYTFLGIIVTGIIQVISVGYTQNKIARDVTTVKSQTNGINTALLTHLTGQSAASIETMKTEGSLPVELTIPVVGGDDVSEPTSP